MAAGLAIRSESATEICRVRAAAPCLGNRHRRAHAEGTSLVGSGSHHTPGADASHHHRLAAQRRLVPLLDRSEKGVQVEMQHGRLATHKVILAFEWGAEAIAALRRWVSHNSQVPPVAAMCRGVRENSVLEVRLTTKDPHGYLAGQPVPSRCHL